MQELILMELNGVKKKQTEVRSQMVRDLIRMTQVDASNKLSMICVTLNGIILCGLLLAITLLFIILVNNGLKSAGMGGLILSLVPPLAVFTIGLIINQKYFKSQTEEPPTTVTTTPEPGEPNQAMAIQMDDNEGDSEGIPLLLQVRVHP